MEFPGIFHGVSHVLLPLVYSTIARMCLLFITLSTIPGVCISTIFIGCWRAFIKRGSKLQRFPSKQEDATYWIESPSKRRGVVTHLQQNKKRTLLRYIKIHVRINIQKPSPRFVGTGFVSLLNICKMVSSKHVNRVDFNIKAVGPL